MTFLFYRRPWSNHRRPIMRRNSLPMFAAISMIGMASTTIRAEEPRGTAKEENKLVGTWKLVAIKSDGKELTLPEGFARIKHVTPTQFNWVDLDKDSKIRFGLGGTYTLKGDKYEETPEYGLGGVLDAFKGKVQSFTCKVDGNKWYHTGKLSSGLEIDEVWERVEKK